MPNITGFLKGIARKWVKNQVEPFYEIVKLVKNKFGIQKDLLTNVVLPYFNKDCPKTL